MDINDEINQESNDSLNNSGQRNRGPGFKNEEVDCLLELIEKNKNIILGRLPPTKEAKHARNSAWEKITKKFNSKGFKHNRTVENLQYKWGNLKALVRNDSKKVMYVTYNTAGQDHVNRTLALIYEQENIVHDTCLEAGIDEEEGKGSKADESSWSLPMDHKDSDDSEDDNEDNLKRRSLNFTPTECKILFECAKKVKDVIMIKSPSQQASLIRNKAWNMVEEEFNSKSEVKRPLRVLKTKFQNIMRKVNRGNLRAEEQYLSALRTSEDIPLKRIKSESLEVGYDDDYAPGDAAAGPGDALDPLESVLNGTSDAMMPWNQPESKEVVKLKIELLNYQIENAKLERKRILQATEHEAKNQESEAALRALRLRGARLAAAAAAAAAARALAAPHHPALALRPEEDAAASYLDFL